MFSHVFKTIVAKLYHFLKILLKITGEPFEADMLWRAYVSEICLPPERPQKIVKNTY